MFNNENESEYSIVITKNRLQNTFTQKFDISAETLVSNVKGNLVINPIYKFKFQRNKNIHLKRRRELLAWELEAIMMLKVLPREIIIDKTTIDDIRNRRFTNQVMNLFRNGILLEAPEKFLNTNF